MATHDLSYQDVADLCKCSKALVGQWIKGKREVSYLHEKGLERIFDLPQDFFLQETVTVRFNQKRISLITNRKKGKNSQFNF